MRGQVAHSLRFMATAWQWREPRVRRFIGRLKRDAMIDASADTGVTVITIRNYNKYQRVSLPTDAAPNASVTQQRRNLGEKEEKEIHSDPNGSEAPASPVYTDSKHELWGEGVLILGQLGIPERAARSNIGRWLKDTGDDAQTVLGAIQRARDHRIIDAIPWITQSLKTKRNANATSQNRADSSTTHHSANGDPIVAGMGRVAGRYVQR